MNMHERRHLPSPAYLDLLVRIAQQVPNPQIIGAMWDFDRVHFVPPEEASNAYRDTPVMLPAGARESSVSAPSLVARMIDHLRPKPYDRILEIGAGSGWSAAILSRLTKNVVTVEVILELASSAAKRLIDFGLTNVEVRQGDATDVLVPHEKFSGIIVTTSMPPDLTHPLFDHLAEGGRMIVPVGSQGGIISDGKLLALRKIRNTIILEKEITDCRFVAMTGAHGWKSDITQEKAKDGYERFLRTVRKNAEQIEW